MWLVLGLNILINNPSATLHRRPNSKMSLILEELQTININLLDTYHKCMKNAQNFQNLSNFNLQFVTSLRFFILTMQEEWHTFPFDWISDQEALKTITYCTLTCCDKEMDEIHWMNELKHHSSGDEVRNHA